MEREIALRDLEGLGLSEWEAKCYWTLIRYGPKNALELSKLSEIARSKVYEVTTRLRRKGFVMKIPPIPLKGMTQKFAAIEPEKVFSTKMQELKELSNGLTSVYANPSEPRFPKINFYNSKKSTKELLLSIFNKRENITFFIGQKGLFESLGPYLPTMFMKCNSKNFKFLISDKLSKDENFSAIKNKNILKNFEGNNFIILRDRVIIDLWKEQFMVLEIISPSLAKSFGYFLIH
jgi:sugar-specific transcriptional regulator TrmB